MGVSEPVLELLPRRNVRGSRVEANLVTWIGVRATLI
jgi:hypothetical protein